MLQLVEFWDWHPELIDSVDWYFMPVANPDGYEYSHSTDRLWRKTRSGAKADQRWGKRKCYGVDPNRNWDFHWGEGSTSSSDPCTDDYTGPWAFSEPETKAMADFILTRKDQIKIYLTLHSYSQMWLVPWGYKNEKPKDYYNMYVLAEKGVEALQAVRGTDYLLGTAAELLYTSSGMVSNGSVILLASLDVQVTYELLRLIHDNYTVEINTKKYTAFEPNSRKSNCSYKGIAIL